MQKFFRYSLSVLFLMSTIWVSQAQDVCSSDGTSEEVNIQFLNDSNTPMMVHWINFECVEQEGTLVAPGEVYEGLSYDGHEFAFRNEAGDSLVQLMVNTLISDEELSVKQLIAEGGSWLAVSNVVNVAREEAELEPIYFSDALYGIIEEGVDAFEVYAEEEGMDVDNITDGADLAFLGDYIFERASELDMAWAGTASGVVGGELLGMEGVSELLTSWFEEGLAAAESDMPAWLSADVQSYAFYADEHAYIVIYSTKSQPDLDTEAEAREAAEAEATE